MEGVNRMVMNLEFFFAALTNAWVVGEVLLALFTTTREGTGKIQDRGTQIILWVVLVASFKIEAWMRNFFPVDMPGSGTWLRPVALGVLILGLAIRVVAIVTLGRAFSANVALRAGQTLQRSGLYGLVRHPSYLGLELILLALALHTRTWACFAVALVPPTLAVLYRIHVEENALRVAFGADYEDYRRSTKRLIPRVY
jgi:protein-S-isoprenylcysteine O-methyltransferase Ste14